MTQGLTQILIPDGTTLESSNGLLQIKDAGVTSAKLSSSLLTGLAKNLIINGDFDVWQRGTSFTSLASGYYASDRWKWINNSECVANLTQDSIPPTLAQSGHVSSFNQKIAITTADTSIAAGQYVILAQVIEGFNWKRVAQRAFTLSFWVKAHRTGIYCVTLSNASDRVYTAEYTVNVADTWEKKVINVAASPSGGTWNYTNGAGLYVYFCLACGSSFYTTAGAWQSGISLGCTLNQINGVAATNDTFQVSQVQLEDGSSATDFESRTYEQELSLCERYCQVGITAGSSYGYLWGVMNDANHLNTVYGQKTYFRTTMRAFPTFDTKQNGSETLTTYIASAPGANALAAWDYLTGYISLSTGTFGFGAYTSPEAFNFHVWAATGYFLSTTAGENINVLLGSAVKLMFYAEL